MLSWNQIALLIAPWLLLATTYPVYQFLDRRFGKKGGYLGGFLFYWIGSRHLEIRGGGDTLEEKF